MKEIFKIASTASTPLAITGIALCVLFYIFKSILERVRVVKQNDGTLIIFRIIKVLYTVSIICILLGFLGYLFKLGVERYYPNMQEEQVSVGTDQDYYLKDFVEIVAKQQNVTIYFNSSCDTTLNKIIIESGDHYGKNTMDFFINLKERIKGDSISYDIKQKSQSRFEIICN